MTAKDYYNVYFSNPIDSKGLLLEIFNETKGEPFFVKEIQTVNNMNPLQIGKVLNSYSKMAIDGFAVRRFGKTRKGVVWQIERK